MYIQFCRFGCGRIPGNCDYENRVPEISFSYFAAVLIGASGSFVTGTGLGSNIMFAPMHVNACSMLDINPVTVFAGQNAGGSLGNMVCPNNVVAACATVDIIGREGEVMRKGIVVFGILLLEYMILAMIYTHILFPNFGL